MERPTDIINQKYPKEITEEFIDNICHGSDSNFMLITGDQGVGKSHFLNYFSNQINTRSFGNSLALKIQCKSNRDVVDLYPQITEDLKRVLTQRKEFELIDSISRVLADSGTPRLVQNS